MAGTEPDAGSTLGPLAAGLKALGTTLLVLCGGMVAAAVLIPSGPPPAFRSLDPAAPVSLSVPSLGITASVAPIQVGADRVLDPPQDPLQVGWWQASAEPGDRRGQTVITGHTVHTGGGAMDTIDQVRPGKRIDVTTQEGTMRYRVTGVRVLDKDEVSRDAEALFGQDRGEGRLVLVSCDDWNGSYYESNVVVLGEPLGEPIPKDERLLESAS